MTSDQGRPVTRADYVTIAEAAEMLGVSARTINNYFRAGRLTRTRISPKLVLLARQEVLDLLAGRGCGACNPAAPCSDCRRRRRINLLGP